MIAARPVWVCLVDGEGRPRVDGRTLAAGQHEGPFTLVFASRSRWETAAATCSINGKLRDTPDRSEPLGYLVKPAGDRSSQPSKRPTCG